MSVIGFKVNGDMIQYNFPNLDNKPTIDAAPTANSTNAVQSGGVKSALDTLQAQIPPIDPTLTQSGQAADAKVTGRIKSDLSGAINPYVGTYEQHDGVIASSGKWSIRSDRHYIIIPVSPNVAFSIFGSATSVIAFLTDYTENPTNGSTPSFCSGYEKTINVGTNLYGSGNTPPDCNYLYVLTYNGTAVVMPTTLLIDGHDYTNTILESVKTNNENISNIAFSANSPVNAVMDVAETYFNEAYNPDNSIIYRSERGIFSNPFYNDTKAMVCSQFSQACIAGISYENSRFVSGYNSYNDPFWWGFVSDGSGNYAGVHTEQKTEPGSSDDADDYEEVTIEEAWYEYGADYMSAKGQCDYFLSKGIAHEFNADHNGIKPGDLLYYLASTWNPALRDTADDYISHVAICVRPYKSKYSFIHANSNRHRIIDNAEVGLIYQEWEYATTPPKYYVHLEDIPIIPSKTISELIYTRDWGNASGSISGNVKIGAVITLGTDYALENGFYTINTKISGDCEVYVVQVFGDGTTSIINHGDIIAGESSIVIYIQKPISRIDLYVTNGTVYTAKETRIYKGYHSYDD